MISLDFSLAVSLYILFFLIVALATWAHFNKKEKERSLTLDQKFIWFCNICTYTYVNSKEETLSVCPRCGSYNKR